MGVVTARTAEPARRETDSGSESATISYRIDSMDIVRGIVMVLMAIDHVRVYSGLPAGGPTPGIFFTRWITHFVAPAFVFLAGTGAYLHGLRLDNRGQLARFLLTRGAWLLLLELTFIRVAWTFNFDFANYLLAGVIWVIGWCMILLAALVFLPTVAIAVFGALVIFGHNLLDVLPAAAALRESEPGWFLSTLYFGGGFRLGENGPPLLVLYSILPWIGVMAAGYAFGAIMKLPAARRRALCLQLGLAATAGFLVLRGIDKYGDPRHWHTPPVHASNAVGASPGSNVAGPPAAAVRRPQPPVVLRFLGTTKYPASLLFLLMTLGPMMIGLGLLESARGRVTSVLATFGRVPLFYYLLHIPLIHLAAVVVSLLRSGNVDPWLFANHPMMVPPAPTGYTWSLPLLYLVTAVTVALLYIPCRWFAALKQRKRSPWLSYF